MNQSFKNILIFTWCLSGMFCFANAQTSTLVSLNGAGKLVYTTDAKGDKVPDFSGVGYMNGESAIPTIQVVKTVNALAGDNLTNIQTAIDEVAAMPLDANGFRGAILFKAGTYNVSEAVNITASGIILRGEGAATNFIATKTSQFNLFNFKGASSTGVSSSTTKAITDAYVPVGAKQVTVAAGHTFAVGSNVFVHRIPNQAWITLLKMDILSTLPGADASTVNWTPSTYDVYYERKVTAVNGNSISLDAPIMDMIDPTYSTGEVMKFNDYRIQKCGIEYMKLSSTYTSETDENHGWAAITFNNITNSWARNVEIYYFGYSAVQIQSKASFITVDACKMLDAKSTVDGGRRYSFAIDGQRSLVQNCVTRNGRHDYVNGSVTAGPNVFYNCSSTLQLNDIGPHHRWSTGILFDKIVGDGKLDVQNRTTSGTGHGWAGAQIMFWNCEGNRMAIQDPQGDHVNWSIGFIGTTTNIGDMTTEPLGIVESNGTHITAIPSLFMAQLNERLAPLGLPQNTSTNFTSSTTWVCPAGVTSVDVECWGGGGSGGSATSSKYKAGGGGGGGSYVKSTIAVVPGTVYNITVGSGGVQGATANANCSGNPGGKSEFSGPSITTVTASGGAAGTGGNAHTFGGAGGVLGGLYRIAIINAGTTNSGSLTGIATVSGGGGSGIITNTTLVSGALSYISVMTQGSGYTSVPTVTISGDGTASAYVSLDVDAGSIIIKGDNGNSGIANTGSGAGGSGANGGVGGNSKTTLPAIGGTLGDNGVAPGGGGSGAYGNATSPAPDNISGAAKGGAGATGQVKLTYAVDQSLPVSLTLFTAQKQATGVQLKWTTVSEQNNSHFYVQRSSDGVSFIDVAKVNGAGKSNEAVNYYFIDKSPASGVNYYRLNQVDFDGKASLSKVVSVNMGFSNSAIQVFTSPSSSTLAINISTDQASTGQLVIYNIGGQKVFSQAVSLNKGANEFSVNLSNTDKGVLLATYNSSYQVLEKKFIR